MRHTLLMMSLALAGLAPAAAACAAAAKASATPSKAPAKVPAKAAEAPSSDETIQSEGARRVADWVASSGDNHALPYAIIDKQDPTIFLFDAKGKPLGKAPVLIGVSAGDEATPGIGSKNLAEIGPAEKTTPAGRFLAKYGRAAGKARVLWVDYATSVALHPIPPGANRKEHRPERMLSPTTEDNRITFGCINVPKAFYSKAQAQFLKKGGYVYILPDTKPIEDVFPRLRVEALAKANITGSSAGVGAQ